ncbi:MAG: hypothetical protein AAGF49_15605 [Pseudomonadota bacterium]
MPPFQRDAFPVDPLGPRIDELIRTARLAGFMDVADWAISERNGYQREVPTYRKVSGIPMAFSPLQGWVPLYLKDKSVLKTAGAHDLRQSVGAIEQAIAQSLSGKAYVHYGAEQIRLLNAHAGATFAQMSTCLDVALLKSVLRSVRALTMHWQAQISVKIPEDTGRPAASA